MTLKSVFNISRSVGLIAEDCWCSTAQVGTHLNGDPSTQMQSLETGFQSTIHYLSFLGANLVLHLQMIFLS
jgi:hypothetical protein